MPTSAPAAIAPTRAPAATGQPELKPPPSGGVLIPPTVNPTTTASSSVPAGQSKQGWKTFREPALGLSFQYPQDWRQSTTRSSKDVVESILLAPSNQPVGNAASILIDVRKKEGDLLPWLSKQLPTGLLLIDAKALEGGANSYMNYNARLAGAPAVFLYAPAPITSTVPVAALHLGDDQYFYQFTYLGGRPDSLDDRAAFLRLLSTTMLSRTIQSGLALPSTTFTKGIDLTKIK